jgi:hypothetical protein
LASLNRENLGETQMLNKDFDPFQALMNLDANMQNLIKAHNLLAREVEQQAATIDVLIKGLDAANKANEQLLTQGLNTLYTNFTSSGQH